MEHDQFELLVAAVLAAGQISRQQPDEAKPVEVFAKTLEELRAAQLIVRQRANFVPKGGR